MRTMVDVLQEIQLLLLQAQTWEAEEAQEHRRLDAEYQWLQQAYHRRVQELKRSLVTYEWPENKVENLPQFQDHMKAIGAPPIFEKPAKAANPFLRMIHSLMETKDFPERLRVAFLRYDVKWHRLDEALQRITVILANERYAQRVSVHNTVSNPPPDTTSRAHRVRAERGSTDSAP